MRKRRAGGTAATNLVADGTIRRGYRRSRARTVGRLRYTSIPTGAAEGPTPTDRQSALARLGAMVLADGCVIKGTIAASEPGAHVFRLAIPAVPGRAASRADFAAKLEALTHGAGYVLETTGDERELIFYAWESSGSPLASLRPAPRVGGRRVGREGRGGP